MSKLKVPPYPYKGQTFSIKWAEKKMKEFGAVPITEEQLKNDPFLRKMCKMPRT